MVTTGGGFVTKGVGMVTNRPCLLSKGGAFVTKGVGIVTNRPRFVTNRPPLVTKRGLGAEFFDKRVNGTGLFPKASVIQAFGWGDRRTFKGNRNKTIDMPLLLSKY